MNAEVWNLSNKLKKIISIAWWILSVYKINLFCRFQTKNINKLDIKFNLSYNVINKRIAEE